MHIVYSIAARFTFFFFFKGNCYTVAKTFYLQPLKKPTFYHSDVWLNTWIKS